MNNPELESASVMAMLDSVSEELKRRAPSLAPDYRAIVLETAQAIDAALDNYIEKKRAIMRGTK